MREILFMTNPMETHPTAEDREKDLAAREAALAAREAEFERQQAELEALRAAKADGTAPKAGFLNNGDPNFQNPKEKLYDRFPLTVHQMDIIIGILLALIVLFIVLGVNHVSFFGLF
jgi:hypothetical protein